MYRLHLKQAIEMLRQNKFAGVISIIGTALAIMMIMVIIVSYSVKNTNIAPEINRSRTLYIDGKQMQKKDKSNFRNGAVDYDNYKNYFSNMKNAELSSAIMNNISECEVSANPDSELFSLGTKAVDANYWKLMSFRFVEGQPFDDAEFRSGIKKAIISQNTAKRLFGNTADVVGKTIEVDFLTYQVSGIVQNVSPMLTYASAEVYIPYTAIDNYEESYYAVLVLAEDAKLFDTIEEEVRMCEQKYNATDNDWLLSFYGPRTHEAQQINAMRWGTGLTPEAYRTRMIFILSLLLIIPAINLSGISIARMMKRTEEIGIRKAFGAKKQTIMIQTLYENLITTLIGGIIGLVLSYAVVAWLRKWLLGVDASIPIEGLVSAPVFITVFVICLLLNLLSAGIPAYKASRMKIVDSLNR